MTCCPLLEALLTAANCPQGSEKEVYEVLPDGGDVFGGAFGADKTVDYRRAFSIGSAASGPRPSKIPAEGGVRLLRRRRVEEVGELEGRRRADTHVGAEGSPSSIVVPTMDTTRLHVRLDALADQKKPRCWWARRARRRRRSSWISSRTSSRRRRCSSRSTSTRTPTRRRCSSCSSSRSRRRRARCTARRGRSASCTSSTTSTCRRPTSTARSRRSRCCASRSTTAASTTSRS